MKTDFRVNETSYHYALEIVWNYQSTYIEVKTESFTQVNQL
jgi:predicted nuclease of restriction endonuclease-like RecB superfamily